MKLYFDIIKNNGLGSFYRTRIKNIFVYCRSFTLFLEEICVGFLVAYTGFMSQVYALSTLRPSFQTIVRPYMDHQGVKYVLVLLLATKWDP